MIYIFNFRDGHRVTVDTAEFCEPDGIGAVLDHLASKHGGITSIELT